MGLGGAPIIVVIAAAALLALLREGSSDRSQTGITLEDIAEEPNRFFGETVAVMGGVFEILGPSSLLISDRFSAGDLLVVSPVPLRELGSRPGVDPLSEADLLQVTGRSGTST